jgi:alanine racemase
VPIARAALEAGASFLGVATVDEGAELREAGISASILLFSIAAPEELASLAAFDLRPFVSTAAYVTALEGAAASEGARIHVHLKVDTGMGRLGCAPEEALALARTIRAQKHLALEGLATHLAVQDSPLPEDLAYTAAQLARFREAADALRVAGIDPGLVHAGASGALVFHPEACFDLIRPGIALYGYPPGPFPARPVMELRSAVACVKQVKKGDSISYGRAWTAPEDSAIAVLPLGYGDGLPRGLSGTGFQVLIRGKPYPVVGRICMVQCMVCRGPSPEALPWDEAVIFGPQAGAETAASLAARIGTIPYEITCGISRRVPRVYNKGNE